MRILILLLLSLSSFAQPWKAVWITSPGDNFNIWSAIPPDELRQYQVLKFRKSFELASKPASFVVHVSADNRYKLYVNGTLVSMGPARGDLMHWNYETVDIAKHLVAGENVVAALVWNEGPGKPEAQISLMTAFIMQGKSEAESVVNTDASWKVIRDESFSPLRPRTHGYYVAGQGEFIVMSKSIRGYEVAGYDDTSWKKPRTMHQGIPKGVFTFAPVNWMLVPSILPQMELTPWRLSSVRKVDGVKLPGGFPKSKVPLTIPPNTSATLLIDNEVLTNAYARLEFSDGKNAAISLAYAEALYAPNKDPNDKGMPDTKGNRNEVDGKVFIGRMDSLISDGSKHQKWESLWYRTYRYVQLKVKTAEQSLVINDIYGVFTGYPFQVSSTFVSDIPALKQNLEIGWRTARLCAGETYMDCPYYEQLQYFGDTRIQCLVTLFNSRDDRLVRNAILQGDQSRFAEGITMSRYPTAQTQIIPPFSLWWIAMIDDYRRYRDDEQFVKDRMPGIRQVLSFFEKYQQEDGSVKDLPYWVFTDWVDAKGWKDGVAPIGKNGNSAVIDILLLSAYEIAGQLEEEYGSKQIMSNYRRQVAKLAKTIQEKYWDESKGLFADTPEKDLFSQHTNAMAIYAGLVCDWKSIGKKMLTDQSLTQASIYFKYYVHQAGIKAGYGNDYLKWLGKWDENIAMGLTTWAEMSDVAGSRSDCHAWGASPNIEMYRTVLGIDSFGPGFKMIEIEPHLGDITNITGSIPHPNGQVSVSYVKDKGMWNVSIELPKSVKGSLNWNGKTFDLNEGKNTVNVNR